MRIMSKILHSAALLSPPLGVIHQMQWERDAAVSLGLDWDVKMYCPMGNQNCKTIAQYDSHVSIRHLHGVFSKLRAWVLLRINYYRWLRSIEGNYDAIVLRYYVHDLFQLIYLWTAKKPVFLVCHTLEVPELLMERTPSAYFRGILEWLIGRFCLRAAAGVIAVTNEIARYECERANLVVNDSFVYPNGIIYADHWSFDDLRGTVPEFIFVAGGFASWHGLDLLLDDLAKCNEDFLLHVVGSVSAQDMEKASNDCRVIMHGILSHAEIVELSKKCWVGIASFALFRKGMNDACTLKVREYLMMGLPVYSGHNDMFPPDFDFYYKGGPSFTEILSYAYKMRVIDKRRVAAKAENFIDKKSLLASLYAKLTARLI